VVTSVHTETKKAKLTNKSKINESFNYGRTGVMNKSIDKIICKRENPLENRISRKYKEKFNQSLVSKSKDKCTQRSRVNSSLTGIKKELHPPILLEDAIVPIKHTKKRHHGSIKCDTSKIIESNRTKPRRL